MLATTKTIDHKTQTPPAIGWETFLEAGTNVYNSYTGKNKTIILDPLIFEYDW